MGSEYGLLPAPRSSAGLLVVAHCHDIIGKEVVNGEVHYLVEWTATLVPKYELGKAKVLVDKFEARLRAQCRQRGGKRRRGLPPSNAGKQTIAVARATGETQQKKGRGRPWKQA